MRVIRWARKHPGWVAYLVVVFMTVVAVWQYMELDHRIEEAKNYEGHYGEVYKSDRDAHREALERLENDRLQHELYLRNVIVMLHISFLTIHLALNLRFYFNRLQRLFRKPFEKWSEKDKRQVLERVYCESCREYREAKFVEEFRKMSFEMMRLNCKTCGHEIIIRNPKWK